MKTVFVLGAGANKELGNGGSMPVGSELARSIQMRLRNELSPHNGSPGPVSLAIMRSSAGLGNDHTTAMRRIEAGIAFSESIDDFIEEWKSLAHLQWIAKLCISHEILSAEARLEIRNTAHPISISQALDGLRDSWLGLVIRLANRNHPRRDVANSLADISFVTFNYDRCLEKFLFHYLTHAQNIPQADAVATINEIPIMHVYGSLGELPELANGSGVPFGQIDWGPLHAVSTLRTYTEELESGHAELIKRTIHNADRIVFLGFGFHPRNLSILMDEHGAEGKELFGTRVGIRVPDFNRACAYMGTGGYLDDLSCQKAIWEHQDRIFAR